MDDKKFDPQKFIDRESEQELFEDLLQLKDVARILAIEDKFGMGKSQLLQKFQHRCRTARRPRTPVSLVDLSQLPDKSPLGLMLQLERELSSFVEFPNFARLESARRGYDFTTIRGAVDLRSANLTQAKIRVAAVMMDIKQGPVTVNATATVFTEEQQAFAREHVVQAFLDELVEHCRQQLVVLIFDTYDHCDPELQEWLMDHFLEPYCFNVEHRPSQLVVVVAGRTLPDFEQYWSRAEIEKIIKSVRALGKWTCAHVEECLRVHGFLYDERQLKLFCDMIEMGSPPSLVIEAMQSILPTGGR